MRMSVRVVNVPSFHIEDTERYAPTAATSGNEDESAALGVLLILCNLSVVGIGFLATCKDAWDAFSVGDLFLKKKSGGSKNAKVSPNDLMGALSQGVNE